MGIRTRSGARGALSGALVVAATVLVGLPVAAQDGDLCGVLTADDISGVMPGSFGTPPTGFPGTCQWGGTTEGGSGVIVMVYEAPGSAGAMPGAETIDVDGRTAFSMTDPSVAAPTHVVGVETALGPMLIMTVGTDDASVDLPAVTVALTTIAVERYESGAGTAAGNPSPAAASPGQAASPAVAAASAPAVVASDLCGRASPEEIATAAGIDVSLTLSELDGTCTWESVSDSGYVLIYVARQDPAILDAMITSLGGEEIDGPGDTDWWVSGLASLFSRTGDEILQVSYASSTPGSDEEFRQTTIDILTVLLAP